MENSKLLEAEKVLSELEYTDAPKDKIDQLKDIFGPMFEKEKQHEIKKQYNIQWSWGSFVPHTKLQDAINTLTAVITYHQEAKLEEDKYHAATQDLLHAFELTEPTDEELIKLGRQLISLRRQRRNTKNFLEITEPLFNYAVNNRNIAKELGQIHNEMINITKRQNSRSYTAKETTSLQHAFDKAKIKNVATV